MEDPTFAGQPSAAGAGAAPAVARKNWFVRHKVITAVGAVALLVIIGGIAGGGGSKSVDIAPAVQAVASPSTPDQAALAKAAAAKAATGEAAAKQAAVNQAADAAAAKAAAANAAAAKAAAAKAAAAPQLGQTVRDGDFAFTVTAVNCGISQVGTDPLIQKAQGQYCRASLKVENIGKEAQTMFSSNQYLFDSNGRKFSADNTAAMYDSSSQLMFQQINPGNSTTGSVYFDVPKGITVSKLELHDSAFSGGVTLRL